MKSLSVACILLALVGTSYQADTSSYCYYPRQFTKNLNTCLGIVLTADLDSLSESAINDYCTQIQMGAACMDGVVEGCKDAFDADTYGEMKGETNSLVSDFEDICKELKDLAKDSFDDRALPDHARRSTSAFNTLRMLHPSK